MAQDRDQWEVLQNKITNMIPYNLGKFCSSRATGGFRRSKVHGIRYEIIKP
jgi:hypothetical protein